MYFIKKINIDAKQSYVSSNIVDITKKPIAYALMLLEKSVKDFIREELGNKAAAETKVIDILNIAQVAEPIIDCILLYRTVDDPHKIIVYQKTSDVVKSTNWTWGTSDTIVTNFRKICIYELEEFGSPVHIESSSMMEENMDMVSIGVLKIKIPRMMTIAPMSDLITELKNSNKFKARLEKVNKACF